MQCLKRFSILFLLAALVSAAGVANAFAKAPSVPVLVTNPTDDTWPEVPVVIPWNAAMDCLGHGVLAIEGPELSPTFVQRDDLDADGHTDELVFLIGLAPRETKRLHLVARPDLKPPPPRAHAGMYLRGLVGPAWESDVAAYRIYFNSDTGLIDVFGKTSPMLSLRAFAGGGFNYHVESKYGMDVLKVGQSLGCGGFGVFIDGRIWRVIDTMKTHFVRADGPLRAVLDCEFIDWYTGPGVKQEKTEGPGLQRRLDLYARFTIVAGQKWGEVELLLRPVDKGPVPEIVTGVLKQDGTELIRRTNEGILGRWGNQALGDHEVPRSGNLGLGVIVNPSDAIEYGEDAMNSYVRLKTTHGRVRYRHMASWFKEPGGARSAADFEQMLRAAARLRPQVTVDLAPN